MPISLLRRVTVAPCLVLPAFAASIAFSPVTVRAQAVQSLIATDTEFGGRGTREPFVDVAARMFAEHVVLQSATLVYGRTAALERVRAGVVGREGARAEWKPLRAGVSADGQQGFTYGYMTIATDTAQLTAKYVAYWARQAGAWRVVAFKIAPRPAGAVTDSLLPAIAPSPAWRGVPRDSARSAQELAAAETTFGREGETDIGAAFRRYGDPEAVNVGRGPAFTFGNESIAREIGAAFPPGRPGLTWGPERVIVAASGDLGVSMGYIRSLAPPKEGAPPSKGTPFFTIWRRAEPGAPWRYIAE